jgi:hypothetical protein
VADGFEDPAVKPFKQGWTGCRGWGWIILSIACIPVLNRGGFGLCDSIQGIGAKDQNIA